MVHEFYANLSDNIVVQGEDQFEKFFVRGHIYEFSPGVICEYLNTTIPENFTLVIYEYLNITIPENFTFEKDYALDGVEIELLRYKCVWPKTNVLRVADLTLKYSRLHKIA